MKKNLFLCVAVMMTFLFSSCSQWNDELKLLPVKSGEKWGYIDKKGKYAINPQFADAGLFVNGLAKVESPDGKIGYINTDGKYAISPIYKEGTSFSEDLAFVVSNGGHITCINKNGETKFILKDANFAMPFSEGLAAFSVVNAEGEEKMGFIDKSGKIIINPQFQMVLPFSEGLAPFAILNEEEGKRKMGFIDKAGKIIIDSQFEMTFPFSEGLAPVFYDKKIGFIDKKGKYVINPQFNNTPVEEISSPVMTGAIVSFYEGLAMARQDDLLGYINKKGEFVINPQFEMAFPFFEGRAAVMQNNKWGIINKEGKYEVNPQFDRIIPLSKDFIIVEDAYKWGFIDEQGKYIINPQFDGISHEMVYSKILRMFPKSIIESDHYDASAFVDKFFQRIGNNSFDGFTATSTLEDIVDNAIYGNHVNCPGDGTVTNYESGADVHNFVENSMVISENSQFITKDISIDETTFHFEDRICYVAIQSNGNKTRKYVFDEKIGVISYKFHLTKEAYKKEDQIADEMKKWLESKFKVKFTAKETDWDIGYDFASNNKFSFAVITSKDLSNYDEKITNHLEFFIAFHKEAIPHRLRSYYTLD